MKCHDLPEPNNPLAVHRLVTNPSVQVVLTTQAVTKTWHITFNWKFDTEKCVDATALIVETSSGNRIAYIGSHSKRFSAVEMDGKEIWTVELGDRIEASAAYDPVGNRVCVGCYDGLVYCLDCINGVVCWTFQTEDQVKCTAFCSAGYLYFGSHDKTMYCLELESGNLVWKTQISSGSIFSSPALSLDRLIVATLDGTVRI